MREVNLHDIDIENDDNLLPFEEIDLDYNTKQTTEKLKNDSNVTVEDITEFYKTVQKFYKLAYKGAVTRLPFNEEFLQSSEFLNPATAIYIEKHQDQMQTILKKFPSKFNTDTILMERRELPSHFSP